ncbi:MAG: recombinase family protein [Litorimonas sp.]
MLAEVAERHPADRTRSSNRSQASTLRCAVYTRKSHDEGLDRSFNSLDAQGEACRAFIMSQAGLGWQLRDARYNDASISGGHMDRPGLQVLIADIEAGLVDIVVVYKVDRLTRSLSDFSRLVETFDAHNVSFVSVTQAFNTTTPMGRLTLNVLLSFAQFEREVTAERIRDKIAASKAKGMWMGGLVPLGFRSEDRKLVIDEVEAETVRLIFSLYQHHSNVRLVKRDLDANGKLTKRRISKTGKGMGGEPFSRGHIHRILTNPVYIGKIVHKGKVHDGLHEAIIARDVWDNVQAILDSNTADPSTGRNTKSPSYLAGLLEDEDGHPLVAHHTKTRGKRYRYYVSQNLKTGDADNGWRVPARTIEALVAKVVKEHFSSDNKVSKLFAMHQTDAQRVRAILSSAKSLATNIANAAEAERSEMLRSLLEKIVIGKTGLTLQFDQS